MVQFKPIDQQLAGYFAELPPENSLLLTPNKRLSRYLNACYGDFMASRNVRAYTSLSCFSYQGWLRAQWETLITLGECKQVLMTPQQELLIWESIVESHPETPPLLNIPATAKLANDAWRILQAWKINDGEPIFLAWRNAFENQCREMDLISGACLSSVVGKGIEEEKIVAPKHLLLFGFDEITPEFQFILDAFKKQGAEVSEMVLERELAKVHRVECHDDLTEIKEAALWAKNILAQGSNVSIGIVVPELSQQRHIIETQFSQVFEPQYIWPSSPQHAPGFNFSAGQPLSQTPLVAISLLVFETMLRKVELDQLSKILLSPFLGLSAELDVRAQCDIKLRNIGETRVSLNNLRFALKGGWEEDAFSACPDFYERVKTLKDKAENLKRLKRLPSQWAMIFIEQLQVVGWPGERQLDTIEYQQVQSWREVVEEFSGVDYVAGKISFSRALKIFRSLLGAYSFQAQTRTSPVQVLGVLEAAGLSFDYLWIMGMDSESWPPAPSPNPLIPIAVQVQHRLPQSSAEREYLYALRLTERFCHSAEHVIFSSVKSLGDKQLAPSPLIEHFSETSLEFSEPQDAETLLFSSQEIEASFDSCGPQLLDFSNIRGGSQILKSQAACPFQAFARYRLLSSDIPTTAIGLSPTERGNLVHSVMEIIWRKLKNQQKLLNTSEQVLKTTIEDAIHKAINALKKRRYLGDRLVGLETKRIFQQVRAWLELEKQRAPFTVVFNEGKKTIKLGKLPINVRYDRVDKLSDGSLFVLDYKTGEQNIRSWDGERPDEPQVPLYAIANQKKISGAALGQISADDIVFKGIAEDETIAPGLTVPDMLFKMNLPNSWPAILLYWRDVLENLAREFIAGSASVDPKKPHLTCRYCELQSLCRIHEQFNLDEEPEQEWEQ